METEYVRVHTVGAILNICSRGVLLPEAVYSELLHPEGDAGKEVPLDLSKKPPQPNSKEGMGK